MSNLTSNLVYVPLLNIYGRICDYESIVCGVFRNETEALRAIVKKLVELKLIGPNPGEDDELIDYKGETLKLDDIDFNIQLLCKYVNTLDDVKDISEKVGFTNYRECWDFSINKYLVQ